jgi:hypothetical protein
VSQVKRIIETEKPAHTSYILTVVHKENSPSPEAQT